MGLYYTKRELYNKVHQYKNYLGFDANEYGLDLVSYSKEFGFITREVSFNTKGLRGMATVSVDEYSDIILLNSNRNYTEQNFDCAHEMMHLGIHRELEQKTFKCMDRFYSNRDEYVEWQANEGAAELLVPYEMLLTLIKAYNLNSSFEIRSLKDYASDIFNVSKRVIEYRLESLKYEIHQYLNGTSMREIQILSSSSLRKNKIKIKSINEIEDDLFDNEMSQWSSSHFINFESIYNNM